jgi:hypothetical protein
MENAKVSKKSLNGLLNDSMREAIQNLELPKPTKKVKKILDKSSKKLAAVFSDILKKQQRKSKKESRDLLFVEDVLQTKKQKKSKARDNRALAGE